MMASVPAKLDHRSWWNLCGLEGSRGFVGSAFVVSSRVEIVLHIFFILWNFNQICINIQFATAGMHWLQGRLLGTFPHVVLGAALQNGTK